MNQFDTFSFFLGAFVGWVIFFLITIGYIRRVRRHLERIRHLVDKLETPIDQMAELATRARTAPFPESDPGESESSPRSEHRTESVPFSGCGSGSAS